MDETRRSEDDWMAAWTAEARRALLASPNLDAEARDLIAAVLERLPQALGAGAGPAPADAFEESCPFVYPH